MICPQCQAEYREGFITCSTCEVPLVDKPHSPEDDEPPIRTISLLFEVVLCVALILGFVMLRKGGTAIPNSWRLIYLGIALLILVLPSVGRYLKKSN